MHFHANHETAEAKASAALCGPPSRPERGPKLLRATSFLTKPRLFTLPLLLRLRNGRFTQTHSSGVPRRKMGADGLSDAFSCLSLSLSLSLCHSAALPLCLSVSLSLRLSVSSSLRLSAPLCLCASVSLSLSLSLSLSFCVSLSVCLAVCRVRVRVSARLSLRVCLWWCVCPCSGGELGEANRLSSTCGTQATSSEARQRCLTRIC